MLALVALFVAACALPAPASGRVVLLGRSWHGRPIEAVEVGNRPGTPVLVVGCIHGNESGGIAIARALEHDRWVIGARVIPAPDLPPRPD